NWRRNTFYSMRCLCRTA
ncbi:sterol-sensing domain of SREBP cleavage-activation family protein, partial [Vibrio harveyi]